VEEERTDCAVALMVEEGRVGVVVTVQFPYSMLLLIRLAQVVQCMLPPLNILVLNYAVFKGIQTQNFAL
jgi:hypothetical protein